MTNRFQSHILSSKGLFFARLLFVCWISFYTIFTFTNGANFVNYIRFFTNMSWIGQLIYMLTASFVSYQFNYMGKKVFSQKFMYFYDVMFACTSTVPVVVTIVYWTMLLNDFNSKTTSLGKFLAITPHATNLMMTLFEILLNRQILTKQGVVWPVLAVILYATMTVVLRVVGNYSWPYPFMRVFFEESPLWVTALFIVGFAVCVIIVYFAMYGLVQMREWAFSKKQVCEADIELGKNTVQQ
ncbi:hypothetical protein EDD86DRAFT_88142 [Gorgonomyces haynaldii]|nr:hypothetical protein EDD86DRAFT_88142 [Gorgonomyces haynaldii]